MLGERRRCVLQPPRSPPAWGLSLLVRPCVVFKGWAHAGDVLHVSEIWFVYVSVAFVSPQAAVGRHNPFFCFFVEQGYF